MPKRKNALRRRFGLQISEYIGQKKVKDNLRVFMKAALMRHEALDHIL